MGDSADRVQHNYSVQAEKGFAAYRVRSKGGHDQLLSPPLLFCLLFLSNLLCLSYLPCLLHLFCFVLFDCLSRFGLLGGFGAFE